MTTVADRSVSARPYYLPVGDEVEIFASAFAERTPVLLKGPTGTGKTRFLEYMDVMVVVHSLTDHRRFLPIARLDTVLAAHPCFLLAVSYNPGYQTSLKDLKHSTRQRFIAIEFGYPSPDAEAEIIVSETGVDSVTAQRLAALAVALRRLSEDQLLEGPSTRLLVYAARLISRGVPARRACDSAVAAVVTDDPVVRQAIGEVVLAHIPEVADGRPLP